MANCSSFASLYTTIYAWQRPKISAIRTSTQISSGKTNYVPGIAAPQSGRSVGMDRKFRKDATIDFVRDEYGYYSWLAVLGNGDPREKEAGQDFLLRRGSLECGSPATALALLFVTVPALIVQPHDWRRFSLHLGRGASRYRIYVSPHPEGMTEGVDWSSSLPGALLRRLWVLSSSSARIELHIATAFHFIRNSPHPFLCSRSYAAARILIVRASNCYTPSAGASRSSPYSGCRSATNTPAAQAGG